MSTAYAAYFQPRFTNTNSIPELDKVSYLEFVHSNDQCHNFPGIFSKDVMSDKPDCTKWTLELLNYNCNQILVKLRKLVTTTAR